MRAAARVRFAAHRDTRTRGSGLGRKDVDLDRADLVRQARVLGGHATLLGQPAQGPCQPRVVVPRLELRRSPPLQRVLRGRAPEVGAGDLVEGAGEQGQPAVGADETLDLDAREHLLAFEREGPRPSRLGLEYRLEKAHRVARLALGEVAHALARAGRDGVVELSDLIAGSAPIPFGALERVEAGEAVVEPLL